ncbi:MAG TPA: UDP-4-amino-4,6-dideoxy-N-acetyl-beta-L-altrosamine transaminase [Chloroflexota bacterium]|jgi:perosamine synthetase
MTILALEGGRPVRPRMLPYGRQSVDAADVQAVVDVLQSDWLTTGPGVAAFEAAFAARVGARHAVAVSNGTAALHAAAFAAGLGPGAAAIVTPMTFAASANCVRYQGGTVVFADVRPDTLNLDPARVAAAIGPRTRAIVVVDYTGQPADLGELNAIAARHGLVVIEDAAHALGATYRGRPVGALTHLTTFSLHPVKHITTGEGGVVTTDDAALAERLRLFRNHGITSDHRQREAEGSWVYEMVALGYNYRITDFQCALGLSQLGKLDGWVARRRAIAARYTAAFANCPAIEPPPVLPDRESAWHLYVIRLNLERLRATRVDVFRALRAENIGVNVHYVPVPWHPYYRELGYARGQWPVAEAAYERMLSLPLFPAMTDADVDDVIAAVQKVVGHYRR